MADEATISPWERSLLAADRIRERCRRAAKALDAAGVVYAVIGGNAVADWVERADEGAARNTRDVNLLVRRIDLPAVCAGLESAGFIHQQQSDEDRFIDGPDGRARSGVQLLFASEKMHPNSEYAFPDLEESERGSDFQVVTLPALVRMKLSAWRLIDRVHLRDLMGVGLIDASWPARFPPPLGARLQELLDDPNG